MAARPMNMLEKIANVTGALYRHQKAQFPRRLAILRGVWKHEMAPPKQADFPAIKADFARLTTAIQSGAYRQLSVREGLVYSAVLLEVVFWFFVGEMIGRRYIFGYLVNPDYVSKDTRRKVAEAKKEKNNA